MESVRFIVRVRKSDFGVKANDRFFVARTKTIARSYQVFEAFSYRHDADILVIVCFEDYWTGKPLPLYRPLEDTFQLAFQEHEIHIDFID